VRMDCLVSFCEEEESEAENDGECRRAFEADNSRLGFYRLREDWVFSL
jgi:hypothetical protein